MDTAKLLLKNIPADLQTLLTEREGAPKVVRRLKKIISLEDVATDVNKQLIWQNCALFYRFTDRPYQAIEVMGALYDQMLLFQDSNRRKKKLVHKGMPLVWLSDFHHLLGNPVTSKRYAMLTLCEDALAQGGKLDKKSGGIYFRLAWHHGMADFQIDRYAAAIYKLRSRDKARTGYPEWILQNLDTEWMTEYPSSNEALAYLPNRFYVRQLIRSLGKGKGKTLEVLAAYLLAMVPGFRASIRKRTKTTDIDVFVRVEGINLDFRAELGRYLICECKDWKKKATAPIIAKFCQELEYARCRSGILFSKSGITGTKGTRDAARLLLRTLYKNGIVILVVDKSDLNKVARGANFITMMREKYEQARFDLS